MNQPSLKSVRMSKIWQGWYMELTSSYHKLVEFLHDISCYFRAGSKLPAGVVFGSAKTFHVSSQPDVLFELEVRHISFKVLLNLCAGGVIWHIFKVDQHSNSLFRK